MSSDKKPTLDGASLLPSHVARRSFLQVLGAAFSTAVLPEALSSCANEGEQSAVDANEALTVSSSVNVVRPQDLLVLKISFINLKRNPAGNLIRLTTAAPSQIILDFPPQAVVEDAVPLGTITGSGIPQIQPIFANSLMGGPSRLIFRVPDSYTPQPYSLSSILGICAQSSLVLTPTMQSTIATVVAAPPSGNPTSGDPMVDRILATALAPSDPSSSARAAAFNGQAPLAGLTVFAGTGSAEPQGISDNSVSQIEIPFRMKLSPNALSGFSHATTPIRGSTNAYEMWHTVLGARSVAANVSGTADERNAYLRTVRALWTRDSDLGNVPEAIENASLSPAYRQAIVQSSSQTQNAAPIQINRLMLSSLGGYLDARGDWPGSLVSRWVHKMAGGRETFVEVDTPGYLLPFGNSATSLKITRRNDDPNLGPVGELYAFNLVLIGNPVTSYRSAGLQPSTVQTLLQWPFVAVELKATHFVTLPFDPTNPAPVHPVWPKDPSGNPIMVPALGYDRRGRKIHFSVPLYFVPAQVPGSTAASQYRSDIKSAGIGSAPADANNPSQAVSLNAPMDGQRIAYADSRTANTGSTPPAPPKDDTSFATQTLAFDVAVVSDSLQSPPTNTPQFAPVVTSAAVHVEALHPYLKAQPDGSTPPVNVWYHPNFVKAAGLDATNNKSQLLFQLASSLTADFTKDPSGGDRKDCGAGFVAPNMTFNALSRITGAAFDGSVTPTTLSGTPPSVNLGSFTDGSFDPSAYLGMATDALGKLKIFGVFSLLDVIKAVDGGEAQADLANLGAAAEEAALKYAPKFIAEGLSKLEKIVSLISQVKSQVELLYTSAQELVGNAYNTGAGVAGQLGGLLQNVQAIPGDASTIGQVLVNDGTQIVQKSVAELAGKVSALIDDARALYAAVLATATTIGNLDVTTLIAPAPTPGSLNQFVAQAVALQKAVADLAAYGARGAVNAQALASNAANAQQVAQQAAQQAGQVIQTVNSALQIAQGIQQTFGAKLQQLLDVLGVVDGAIGDVQQIASLVQDAEKALDTLREMTVKIDWQPKVGSFSLAGMTVFRPASQHALTLAMEIRAKATEGLSAGVDLSCRLDHFDFCIGNDPIVALQFDHIAFTMNAGKKPDVDVKMNGIKFGGPLAFLETLKQLFPLDGFSDPPYLDVDSNGIHAGFTLSVPNIAVGMFSLENIAISAKLEIPFFTSGSAGSTLTFTFSFCDKDHPFVITVSLLGGGGYFTVTLTPVGIQHLEASINVGAQLSVNLFDIAQGSVSIMAGMTFTIDDPNGDGKEHVTLTAFLRLHGELDVLGIVSISVDLNVSMSYDSSNNMIVAEATLKVDVSIVFFSINVDLPFRKEFHACNNDPTLRQLMPPGPSNAASAYWAEYCNSYAS